MSLLAAGTKCTRKRWADCLMPTGTSSPMDKPEIVAAMAQAAASAGAVAVRIEGIENLRTVRPHLSVPIIGIIKRDLTGSPVRITPYLQDVDAWRRQVPILSLLMPHSALARLILIVY